MKKYYITNLNVPDFYILTATGSVRVFTEQEANEFLKDKPYLVKIEIKQ